MGDLAIQSSSLVLVVAWSYVFGFSLGLGGPGIWLGLVVGLSVASLLLIYRFWTHGVARLPL